MNYKSRLRPYVVDEISGSILIISLQGIGTVRLSAVRARLQVDTNPTLGTVVAFSEVVVGEAEAQYHGGSELPVNNTKVKVVNVENPGGVQLPPSTNPGGRDQRLAGPQQPKSNNHNGVSGEKAPCRFFSSPGGCKKGSLVLTPMNGVLQGRMEGAGHAVLPSI